VHPMPIPTIVNAAYESSLIRIASSIGTIV
jgi:hypothetical protein